MKRGKCIYTDIRAVRCWDSLRGDYSSEIVTKIYRYKILWWTTYRIKQFVPYLSAYYDGEYATNRMLKAVARECRYKAKDFIGKNGVRKIY